MSTFALLLKKRGVFVIEITNKEVVMFLLVMHDASSSDDAIQGIFSTEDKANSAKEKRLAEILELRGEIDDIYFACFPLVLDDLVDFILN